MVRIETHSTKNYHLIGRNLTIIYDFQNTIFGDCLIAVIDNQRHPICHLAFVGDEKEKGLSVLKEKWHLSRLLRDSQRIKSITDEIFAKIGKTETDDVDVFLVGTEFQLTVWKALTQIPTGTCVTYKEVAKMINNSQAVRAVANALAANQVGYLIPCHRVICKNGDNKFSWGIEVKAKMQNFEKQFPKNSKRLTKRVLV